MHPQDYWSFPLASNLLMLEVRFVDRGLLHSNGSVQTFAYMRRDQNGPVSFAKTLIQLALPQWNKSASFVFQRFLPMQKNLQEERVSELGHACWLRVADLTRDLIRASRFARLDLAISGLKVSQCRQLIYIQGKSISAKVLEVMPPKTALSCGWHALAPLHGVEEGDPSVQCYLRVRANLAILRGKVWEGMSAPRLGIAATNEWSERLENGWGGCSSSKLINAFHNAFVLRQSQGSLESFGIMPEGNKSP